MHMIEEDHYLTSVYSNHDFFFLFVLDHADVFLTARTIMLLRNKKNWLGKRTVCLPLISEDQGHQ